MKKTLLCLAFIFCACAAHADVLISWDEIAEYAKANNPDIKRAAAELKNAENAYKSAFSSFLPTVSLRGSLNQGDNELETGDIRFSRDYSYGAYGSYEIFSGFSGYASVRSAARDLEAKRAAYNRVAADVFYNLRTAFVNLIWAHESVELAEAILKRRRENYDMVNLRYSSGMVDKGSLARVEADTELAKYSLSTAKRYVETASANLFSAMGKPADGNLSAKEILTEPKLVAKPQFETFVKEIPEYKIAMYNLQSAEFQLTKAVSSWLPTISLSGSVRRFENAWDFDETLPGRDAWGAGITASLPIFTGGTRLWDTKTAKNNVKIYGENFRKTMYSLQSRGVELYNALKDARENLALRKKYLAAAQLQAKISAQKYVNGLSTYQDWYSIENDFINAEQQLLAAKRNLILAKAQWDNFQGLTFDGQSLQKQN